MDRRVAAIVALLGGGASCSFFVDTEGFSGAPLDGSVMDGPTGPTESIAVVITQPSAGAAVAGKSVPVTVAVTGPVTRTRLLLDGVEVGLPSLVKPFGLGFDSTVLTNGAHTMAAAAYAVDRSVVAPEVPFVVNNAALGEPQAFLGSNAPGGLRNNLTGWVGVSLTVGSAPLSVVSVGRFCAPGNAGNHMVKLVAASTSLDVPGGAVSVTMKGATPLTFQYAALPSPVTLAANTTYYLASEEQNLGDMFYDSGPVNANGAGAGTVVGSISQDGISPWQLGRAGESYGPVNFTYR